GWWSWRARCLRCRCAPGRRSRGFRGWWTACRRHATRCRWGWCCTRRARWHKAPRRAARWCRARGSSAGSRHSSGGYRTSSDRSPEGAMIFELEETVSQNARMKVVGVGGGGGNALNRMVDEGLQGVEFISVNTDAQALLNNKADVKTQIGKKLTRGLGAGAQAEMGIAEMRKHVDTMVTVPNERLLAVVGKGIPFQDALKKADEVLLHATQGISGLITVTGIVNVDFADVRTVMQNGGAAIMGT